MASGGPARGGEAAQQLVVLEDVHLLQELEILDHLEVAEEGEFLCGGAGLGRGEEAPACEEGGRQGEEKGGRDPRQGPRAQGEEAGEPGGGRLPQPEAPG